jgi:hypothetical protein
MALANGSFAVPLKIFTRWLIQVKKGKPPQSADEITE